MHERKRNRLQNFDYSSSGMYFVTSITKNRIPHFGDIKFGQMVLNTFGKIAQSQWLWLAKQYLYVQLHSFVVMPNHVHGILEINRNLVGSGRDLTLQDEIKIKPLSELIGAYKTTSSKLIHLAGCEDFLWQRSFHDSIIRDKVSYYKITNYIKSNPRNWSDDEYFHGEIINQNHEGSATNN